MATTEGWKRLTGDYLERIRKDKEVTLRGVERQTRDHGFAVSRAHVHDIESGRSWLRYPELHMLAGVYDLHPRELFERLPGPPTSEIPRRWSFGESFDAAKASYAEGDMQRAAALFDAAFARTHERAEQAQTSVNAGHCYAIIDLQERALERFQRALRLIDFHSPQRVRLVARMARALAETGRSLEAEIYLRYLEQEMASGLSEDLLAYVEEEYGLVLILIGERSEGLKITFQAIKRYRARGDKASAARKMAFSAHHMFDEPRKALDLAIEADALARESAQAACQLYTLTRLAQAAASANEPELAMRSLDQLERKATRTGLDHYIGKAQRLRIEIGIRLGVETPPKRQVKP